jgi:hypothetical protein
VQFILGKILVKKGYISYSENIIFFFKKEAFTTISDNGNRIGHIFIYINVLLMSIAAPDI